MRAAQTKAKTIWPGSQNGMADPVEHIYQMILENLPACDVLTEQERQIYLRRYEATSMAEFREK